MTDFVKDTAFADKFLTQTSSSKNINRTFPHLKKTNNSVKGERLNPLLLVKRDISLFSPNFCIIKSLISAHVQMKALVTWSSYYHENDWIIGFC